MDSTWTRGRPRLWIEALSGALVLAVGMGFGRFAFTGMYPLMVHDGVINVATGSFAASANYAGYLAGALLASRFPHASASRWCQAAMIVTIACLAALSLHLSPAGIIAIRFVAGVASAIAMVAASVWLFHIVGYHHGAPTLYAGVGAGIALSAELIAGASNSAINSDALWALLAAASLLLSAAAWSRLARPSVNQEVEQMELVGKRSNTAHDNTIAGTEERAPRRSAPSPQSARSSQTAQAPHERVLSPWMLTAIYGLAGFGYIVTATYLPLLVKQALPELSPVHVWAAFGLAAVPSCFLWHALNHRLGSRKSLVLNFLVQGVGVVIPVLAPSPVTFIASALLVGGSFVGTTTIAMSAARHVAHTVRHNLIGIMTASYGVGQILGPIVASTLFAHTHSFAPSLATAAAALVVAAALSLL